MRQIPEAKLELFLSQLPTDTSNFDGFTAADIEETKGAMLIVGGLTLVRDFLVENHAPKEMIKTVDTAMADVGI